MLYKCVKTRWLQNNPISVSVLFFLTMCVAWKQNGLLKKNSGNTGVAESSFEVILEELLKKTPVAY